MKVAATETFRENRERFAIADLAAYDGKWVAFSSDGERVVASAESILELSERLKAAGKDIQEVVLDRIELSSDGSQPGGAEFQ